MDTLIHDAYFDIEKDSGRYKSIKKKRAPKKDRMAYAPSHPNLQILPLKPKTPNQKAVIDGYNRGYNLLLYGTAGTGKSYVSLAMALKTVLDKDSDYKKVVIIRSMAPTKDSGFLPGSLAEKSKIYELPYVGIASELFGRDDAYDILKKQNLVEFTTTSYLRGLTFKDSIVILDEFQNGTMHEIHTVITRIGENCRVIVSGDTKQTDLVKKYEVSGGADAIRVMHDMPSFKCVQFDVDDIVRSGICREWILSREELDL